MQYDPVKPSYDVMFVVKVPPAEQEPGTSSDGHPTCLYGHMLHKSDDPEGSSDSWVIPEGYVCDVCERTPLTIMSQDTEMKWHKMKWFWCEPCNWCVCPECKEDIRFAIQFYNSIYEVHENVFVKGLRSTTGLRLYYPLIHMEASSDNVFVLEDRTNKTARRQCWRYMELCKKTSMTCK